MEWYRNWCKKRCWHPLDTCIWCGKWLFGQPYGIVDFPFFGLDWNVYSMNLLIACRVCICKHVLNEDIPL